MHNAFAVCERGLEGISVQEIKELIGCTAAAGDGVVTFSFKELKELAVLCYRTQSLRRVALLLKQFTFKDCEDIGNEVKRIDVKEFLPQGTVGIDCMRVGTHNFSSPEVTQAISRALKKPIDYKNPKLQIFTYLIDNNCFVGVDFSGFDMAQRDYKVFAHPASMKGTIAYAVVRMSGYERKKKMLITWSKGGTVEIEAALFASGKSVNYYRKDNFAFWKLPQFVNEDRATFFQKIDKKINEDKLNVHGIHTDLRHVTAGKKNAKIAGVEKMITFSCIANDWLDVKYKEGEIDILIGHAVSREMEQMNEFFHQAEYIVAGNVIVVTLNETVESQAAKKGFALKEKRIITRGESQLIVQVYEKK